jgi:hypothetical protein
MLFYLGLRAWVNGGASFVTYSKPRLSRRFAQMGTDQEGIRIYNERHAG